MSDERSRRRFLAAAATGSLFAGCLGGVGSTARETPTETESPSATVTPSPTPTATEASSPTPERRSMPEPTEKTHELQYEVDIDHPAARELGREPTIGDPPGETAGLVVEFQDISCKVCASFDAQTFPMLYANFIQTGDLTFVSRDFPHTKEWTHPATQALESTYARDPDAYWALKSRYYAHQQEYTTDNVYDRTHEFVQTETDVDPDAVVADMENAAYAEAIARDEAIRQELGVTGTPTFFLFRDGEFVTRMSGNQNYRVFENVLGL